MGGKDAGGLWECSPLKVRWHLRVPPPHLSVPTPKAGNKSLSCFEVQLSRKDTVKEKTGILLILKAQRFQAIASMSVSRKVEGISTLHLVCPLLPPLPPQEERGSKGFVSAFPKWSCFWLLLHWCRRQCSGLGLLAAWGRIAACWVVLFSI